MKFIEHIPYTRYYYGIQVNSGIKQAKLTFFMQLWNSNTQRPVMISDREMQNFLIAITHDFPNI